jgi:hypothetical protein
LKSCYPQGKDDKTDRFYGTAVAWFHSCRLLPAEASEEHHLLNGQHGAQGYSFDEGTAAIMWACPEFFAVPGFLGVNQPVYALQLTAQHFEEYFKTFYDR